MPNTPDSVAGVAQFSGQRHESFIRPSWEGSRNIHRKHCRRSPSLHTLNFMYPQTWPNATQTPTQQKSTKQRRGQRTKMNFRMTFLKLSQMATLESPADPHTLQGFDRVSIGPLFRTPPKRPKLSSVFQCFFWR